MKGKHLALVLLIFFCIYGCDAGKVIDKNIDIPQHIWNVNFKPSFEAQITDTTSFYDVYVNLRHTTYYPYSNLWILITTRFPNGKKAEKRVELTLADKDGKWFGDCLGDICDVQIPIQKNAYFEHTGNYTFQFEQIMRTTDLPLVMSVGFSIEKAKTDAAVSKEKNN